MSVRLLWVFIFAASFASSASYRITSKGSQNDEIKDEIGDKPALCDEAVVRQTCLDFDIDNSDTDTAVLVEEVSHAMWATRASTMQFLKFIGVNASDAPARFKLDTPTHINCMELCKKTLKSIDEKRLPPSSDVGCHSGSICDIDLSPGALEQVHFPAEARDFHAGHPVPHTVAPAHHSKSDIGLSITGHGIRREPRVAVSKEDAQIKIANLFRVYPMVDVLTEFDEEEENNAPEADEEEANEDDEEGVTSLANASGEPLLRESQLLPIRTVPRPQLLPIRTVPRPQLLPTRTVQRPRPEAQLQPRPQPTKPTDPVRHWQPRPTKPTDPVRSWQPRPEAQLQPRPQPQPRPRPTKPTWVTEVEKVSVKAQAYVATAIRRSVRETRIMQEWLGGTDYRVQGQLAKVLNSLSVMLSHVVYKIGPQCSFNTYAYVYPHGPESKEGDNFVFFLCDVYFRSNEGEKIETLTHEGSHHALAYTDDVCDGPIRRGQCQGNTAYGRRPCQLLARNYPERAQNNADSYCYYINDINGHSR